MGRRIISPQRKNFMNKSITPYLKSEEKLCRRYIGMIVLFSALIPISMLLSFENYLQHFYFEISDLTQFFVFMLFVTSYLFTVRLMRECHRQHIADTVLPLPFTARQRFSAKLILILKWCILPTVISVTASYFSLLAMSKIFDLSLNIFSELFVYCVAIVTSEFCICAVTLLCSACTSGKGGPYAFPAVGLIIITIIPAELISIIRTAQGVVSHTVVLSPINMIGLGHLQMIYDMEYVSRCPDSMIMIWVLQCAVNIIISCAIAFAAGRVYSSRCGCPIDESNIEKRFKLIFTSLMEIAVIGLFIAMGMGLLGAAIALGIILVYAFISNRHNIDAARLKGYVKSFACVFLIFTVFAALNFITDGFGISPAPDTLSLYDDNHITIEVCSAEKLTFKGLTTEELKEAEKIISKYSTRKKTAGELLQKLIIYDPDAIYSYEMLTTVKISVYTTYDQYSMISLEKYITRDVPHEKAEELASDLKEKLGGKISDDSWEE